MLGKYFFSLVLTEPNDNYDSESYKNTGVELDVPVRNLINALYSRDVSKKVKSAKLTQMRNGIFSSSFAPYGYKRSEKDRHCLLIDEYAADVVRRIFNYSLIGHSAFWIANTLNSENIPSPSLYKRIQGGKLGLNGESRDLWTKSIIYRILNDERYTGTLVCGKRETTVVGSGKKRNIPKDAWIRTSGAVPVIIDKGIWDTLTLKQHNLKKTRVFKDRILFKKVFCGYCGHCLLYIKRSPKPYYRCETLKYTEKYGCLPVLYREKSIIETIKTVLCLLLLLKLDMEKLKCYNKPKRQNLSKAENINREIKRLQGMKKHLYERYKKNLLDKAGFINERDKIESEIIKKTKESFPDKSDSMESLNPSDEKNSINSALTGALDSYFINKITKGIYLYGEKRIIIKLSCRTLFF